MDRARQVAQYWSWLPAFRAVAETQHLPTAAKALCVSPSAVSRTLKLLEEHLGQPLFDRTNGRLELNPSGEILLACVRASMRLVHEGTEVMRDGQIRGTLRLSAPSELASLFLVPALPKLLETNPELSVEMCTVPRAGEALQRGDLDLAIALDLAPHSSLLIRPLCQLEHDVFVGKSLVGGDVDRVLFVVPHDAEGRELDAWPSARPRRVGLRVPSTAAAIDAVRHGFGAAVLPICVGLDAGLHRLSVDSARRSVAMLAVRVPLPGLAAPADAFAKVIRKHVAQSAQQLPGVTAPDWNDEAESPEEPVRNTSLVA